MKPQTSDIMRFVYYVLLVVTHFILVYNISGCYLCISFVFHPESRQGYELKHYILFVLYGIKILYARARFSLPRPLSFWLSCYDIVGVTVEWCNCGPQSPSHQHPSGDFLRSNVPIKTVIFQYFRFPRYLDDSKSRQNGRELESWRKAGK